MGNENLMNKHYNDCYFSKEDGYLESRYVFIEGNNIDTGLFDNLNIGETGFGTGLNLLVLEDCLFSQKLTNLSITYTSVEKYPLDSLVVKKSLSKLKEVSESSLSRHLELFETMQAGCNNGWNSFFINREWGTLKINIFIGDVIESGVKYPVINDCWFLDGHSPDKNPDMWNENVFKIIADNSKKGTTFATFTAAGIVKRGLRAAGFLVRRKKGFGKKRHMILGAL